MNRIIVSGVNDNGHYQDCMKVFLASLKQNAPEEMVYLTLVNCNTDYMHQLESINQMAIIADLQIDNCGAVKRISTMRKAIRECLDFYDFVAWIDNDTIIRKPLDELWEGMHGNALKFWLKDRKKDSHKFQAGIHVMGNGDHVKRWLNNIIAEEGKLFDKPESDLDGHGSPYWMTSQELLYSFFVADKKIKHVQLPIRFNDCEFNNDSVIWHCKNSHFDDQRFQKEFKQYMEGIPRG